MKAFFRLLNTPWVLTEEALQQVVDISLRQNESPDVVAARLGRQLDNTYTVENRDGVAVLPVNGPLFRYANLFTSLSGATSYELLAQDFTAALENEQIKAIVLNVDSPGGEANGTSELADMIYSARGRKPIIAYVGGMAASGGYWLASAADEIVVADTAELGSIGAMMVVSDTAGRDEKNGVKTYRFVSSQSPMKNAPPGTEAGRNALQARLDSLAGVFIEKVAQNRGVDAETVLRDFGQGAVLSAREAIAVGMADRIGSFEGVMAELAATQSKSGMAATRGYGANTTEGSDMKYFLTTKAPAAGETAVEATADNIKAHCPDAAKTLRDDGIGEGVTQGKAEAAAAHATAVADAGKAAVTAERARVSAIIGHAEAKGREAVAVKLATTTDLSVEQVAGVLAASPKGANGAGFMAAMNKEAVPAVGGNADTTTEPSPAQAAAAAVKAAQAAGVI